MHLALGGAVLALVIGATVAQSGAGSPAKGPKAGAALRAVPAHRSAAGSSGAAMTAGPTTTSVLPASAASASSTPGSARPCTPADLDITTTTDRASYMPGVPVRVVTKLVSRVACELDLVPDGKPSCGESLVVDSWSGEQAFPAIGQSEQCGILPSEVLTPGNPDTATVVWDERTSIAGGTGEAPPGRYDAIGSWSWSAGGREQPYEVAVHSALFTILP